MDKNEILKEIRLIDIIFDARNEARRNKDYELSDLIRRRLLDLNVIVKDEKDGSSTWEFGEVIWNGRTWTNDPQEKKIWVEEINGDVSKKGWYFKKEIEKLTINL
jgi:hypothetical protein